jgi:hypothetical protein
VLSTTVFCKVAHYIWGCLKNQRWWATFFYRETMTLTFHQKIFHFYLNSVRKSLLCYIPCFLNISDNQLNGIRHRNEQMLRSHHPAVSQSIHMTRTEVAYFSKTCYGINFRWHCYHYLLRNSKSCHVCNTDGKELEYEMAFSGMTFSTTFRIIRLLI